MIFPSWVSADRYPAVVTRRTISSPLLCTALKSATPPVSFASTSVTNPKRSWLRMAGTVLSLVRSRMARMFPELSSPAIRWPDSVMCSSVSPYWPWLTRMP
jgi:hypothetical protein